MLGHLKKEQPTKSPCKNKLHFPQSDEVQRLL
jgi:hypothetical protein